MAGRTDMVGLWRLRPGDCAFGWDDRPISSWP